MLRIATTFLATTRVKVVGWMVIPSPEEYIDKQRGHGGGAAYIRSFEKRAELFRLLAKDVEQPPLYVSKSEQVGAMWYMGNFEKFQRLRNDRPSRPSMIFVTGPHRNSALRFPYAGCDGIVVVSRNEDKPRPYGECWWWQGKGEQNDLHRVVLDNPKMDYTQLHSRCLEALGESKDATLDDLRLNLMANADAQKQIAGTALRYMGGNQEAADLYASTLVDETLSI